MLELLSRGCSIAVAGHARDCGVREGAVYRDIRRLKSLGYPLQPFNGDFTSLYSFERNWESKCPQISLTLPEIEAVLLAVRQYCAVAPPHKTVRMALAKLHALHSETGSPARVRAWRSIVREAEAERPAEVSDGHLSRLSAAIEENRWCQLMYLGMAEHRPKSLKFLPCWIGNGTLFGRSFESEAWETLNIDRISSVEPAEVYTSDEPKAEWLLEEAGASPHEELERVDQQVLRLLAIVRMMSTNRRASAVELAEIFSTTLTTVRRDRDVLERAGYANSLEEEMGARRVARGSIGFGRVPALPFSAEERSRLLRLLARFQFCHPSSSVLLSATEALTTPAPGAMTILKADSSEDVDESEDLFWTITTAILAKRSCILSYHAHWRIHRIIEFWPEAFELSGTVRVIGKEAMTGELLELQLTGLKSVRLTRSDESGQPNCCPSGRGHCKYAE